MFSRSDFADMRRVGMNVGVPKGKLVTLMLEILGGLPQGTPVLKEAVVARLGLVGKMSSTRDVDAAWNEAKKKAAREYPDRFILTGRKALQWNDGTHEEMDKRISTSNWKKLNRLAGAESCDVDTIVSKLVTFYTEKA